jgi:hypothetical protein
MSKMLMQIILSPQDDLCSQFEASRGMTYLDISNLMDELATVS